MNMNNGLAIIEVNDSQTRSVFIDQEALECARLNARIKKRVSKQQAMAQQHHKAKEKAKDRALKAIVRVLLCCGICIGASLAGTAGLISPIIWVPIGMLCLCMAFYQIGAWWHGR